MWQLGRMLAARQGCKREARRQCRMIGELVQTLLVQVLAGDDLVLQGLGAEGVAVAIPIGSAGQSGGGH